MAGQLLNANAQKHGVNSFLALGRLPRGASYIRRNLNGLGAKLTADVREKYGAVSSLHAALIQSALRHEARAMLLQRWLRLEGNGLPLLERMALVKGICDASDSRDKCIGRLGIDTPADDPWGLLGGPIAQPGLEFVPPAPRASAGQPGGPCGEGGP